MSAPSSQHVAAQRVTRLAPSPTGALHLGNARTFLLNWALAQQQAWRVLLRIEDLDGPRVKTGAAEQAVEDLAWLGLTWDTSTPAVVQSADLAPYRDALHLLQQRGLVYPCRCTRREIEQVQSAPHGDEHELRYPGTCRPTGGATAQRSGQATDGAPAAARPAAADCSLTVTARSDPPTAAWRVVVPDEAIAFRDELQGPRQHNPQQEVGDFIVATKQGLPAYQLAVVVDDARAGVTDIVRGDDLLPSTARQLLLYRYLDLTPLPRYWHVPLVCGPDGRRLAKRHGDTRLSWYRRQGVPVGRVVGLLAWWCGMLDRRQPLTATEFARRFDLAKLPRQPATFATEDHRWLLEK